MDEYERANAVREAFVAGQVPDFWGAFFKDMPPSPQTEPQKEVFQEDVTPLAGHEEVLYRI